VAAVCRKDSFDSRLRLITADWRLPTHVLVEPVAQRADGSQPVVIVRLRLRRLQWLRTEVDALGGQATIFEASSISGVDWVRSCTIST